jgi:hypothetical protein
MAAPDFFRELIVNSATLDATTRRHVAFVVFYGDQSGVVREGDIRYEPYSGRPQRGGLKVRLDGLSISGDPQVASDVMLQPTTPPKSEGEQSWRNHNPFSNKFAEILRIFPEKVNQALFAHHMSGVATRLMKMFDIRESSLPCLLFTDGRDLNRHLVVRLDPREPLDSLYTHVLRPLSDEFGVLSRYWERRDALQWKKSGAEWATKSVAKLQAEAAQLVSEIERQRQIVAEQIRGQQEQLDQLNQARQRRLEALPNKASEQKKAVRRLEEELAAIARGDRQFGSSAHQTLETTKLERRLYRERQRLASYSVTILNDDADQVRRLRESIETLRRHVPRMEQKRQEIEAGIARENKTLEEYSPANLDKEEVEIQHMATELEQTGYGPEVLISSRPSAFAAIEVMAQNGLFGVSIRNPPVRKTMRILFLAANPTATSPLDLEEELRSLENELRGVKYRDQVVLTIRHAVRPDDLVRYVRSEQPTVVHFSGHGSGKGIILRSDEGGHVEVTGASLQRFFMNRGVQLVVLNACYSHAQAKLLPTAVSAVVGTTDSVGDVAARRFTVAFYRSLGEGYSIREAFRDGGDAVVLDNRENVFWSAGDLDKLLVAVT